MKINSLIIAILFALSTAIHAGPCQWIKDNSIKCAFGIVAGIGTMIYFSQSDNNTDEIGNHSPINLSPNLDTKKLLKLARQESITPANIHNREAKPKKSCLKNKNDQLYIHYQKIIETDLLNQQ